MLFIDRLKLGLELGFTPTKPGGATDVALNPEGRDAVLPLKPHNLSPEFPGLPIPDKVRAMIGLSPYLSGLYGHSRYKQRT